MRWHGLAAVAAGTLTVGPQYAAAQHHHHHDHGHHHGHFHDYGHHHHYPPLYNTQPLVYQTAPAVASPAVGVVAGSSPVNAVPYRGAGLKVQNPEGTGGPVAFTVEGQSYQLQPGYQISLDTKPEWTIVFSRGNGQPDARYQIADGQTYQFSADPGTGWELKRLLKATPAAATQTARANVVPTPATSQPVPSPDADVAPAGLLVRAQAPARAFRRGDAVVVASPTAEVKDVQTVVAEVRQGQSYKALDVRGQWVMVSTGKVNGWIHARNLKPGESDEGDAPPVGQPVAAGAHAGHDHK
jgi:hypothetical protein